MHNLSWVVKIISCNVDRIAKLVIEIAFNGPSVFVHTERLGASAVQVQAMHCINS